MTRKQLLLEAVQRGKYAPLYHHLVGRHGSDWRTDFDSLEKILGFSLPNSARVYRPWWANDVSSGHSQSMAWSLAGWKTSDVDMDAETLTFRKTADLGEVQPMPIANNEGRSSAPRMDDFRNALKGTLLEARSRGEKSVVVRAGELHRAVGGYPTPFNRMPMCCKSMYEEQRSGDRIIEKPKKVFGASLTIEYQLPR